MALDQITDSVSQVNTKVLGDAPAMATGSNFIAVSQALANAAHNATSSQQQSNVTSQAANATGLTKLFTLNDASGTVGTRRIYNS
jgi:hypothetical protein